MLVIIIRFSLLQLYGEDEGDNSALSDITTVRSRAERIWREMVAVDVALSNLSQELQG